MGSGSFSYDDFHDYSRSTGKTLRSDGTISSGQKWEASRMKATLDPHGKIRECVDSDEHPNVIPVIIGLDVTGSMGQACQATAEKLAVIMKSLYDKFTDIEIMFMGIGDFECDEAPLQVTQFESDVRIAKQLDDLYMEHGGGGNGYESYSSAWYYALYRTKIDAIDKGRKGIIITMGDEPLNPDLPINRLKDYLGLSEVGKVDTTELYNLASQKFDIYHISIDDSYNCYSDYNQYNKVDNSFSILGEKYLVSSINTLDKNIVDCISKSVNSSKSVLYRDQNNEITFDNQGIAVTNPNQETEIFHDKVDENGGIVW